MNALARALALHHQVICCVRAGRVVLAQPRPLPVGVFAVEDPEGRPLTEALLPELAEPILAMVARADGSPSATLAFGRPERRITLTAVAVEDWVVVSAALVPEHSPAEPAAYELLEAIGCGVIVQDMHGGIGAANECAADLLGVSRAQLTGRRVHEVWNAIDEDGTSLAPEDHPGLVAARSGVPVVAQLVGVKRASGPPVWVEAHAHPLLDPEGESRLAVLSFVDVTPRQNALERLREEHVLLREITEATATGICLVGADGLISFANQAAKEMLGLTPSLVDERTYDAPDWRASDLEGRPFDPEQLPVARVLATRAPVRDVRFVVQVPSGEQRALAVNATPLFGPDGTVSRVVTAFEDITTRERSRREQRRLADDMARVARFESLEQLAGGVAHDFNNLLVGVLGAVGLARAELPSAHPAIEHLDLALEGAERAAELTKQLLAFSGRGRIVIGTARLESIVAAMTKLMRSLVGAGVELEVDAGATGGVVEVDTTQIKQCLMNLVLNAAQSLPDGRGRVLVRTGAERVSQERIERRSGGADHPKAGRYATLEVDDEGGGMPDEVRARMFEPFYSTKESGHGLGLAAVLGAARAHRGFIEVDSVVGRGTCVRLLIPIEEGRPPSVAAPRRTPAAPLLRPGRPILVVDDEEIIRRLLVRMLGRLGAEVITAEDGEEGLATYRAHRGRLAAAIVDLSMPKLRGEQVLAAIRAEDPHFPVILTSGFSTETLDESMDGSTLFMPKPFRYPDVVRALGELLGVSFPHA